VGGFRSGLIEFSNCLTRLGLSKSFFRIAAGYLNKDNEIMSRFQKNFMFLRLCVTRFWCTSRLDVQKFGRI